LTPRAEKAGVAADLATNNIKTVFLSRRSVKPRCAKRFQFCESPG
jgi:hypothetical protein